MTGFARDSAFSCLLFHRSSYRAQQPQTACVIILGLKLNSTAFSFQSQLLEPETSQVKEKLKNHGEEGYSIFCFRKLDMFRTV